ncbi:hypothetical protein [Noviherbaspirillum agri]
MNMREKSIATALVVLMLVFWTGFLFHRDPRFAGDLWGGVLAMSGAILMLVPLAYLLVKRIKPLNRWVTRYVSMPTLLVWHIYAGVLGPILVILHSAHKFESVLGIALTAITLAVVLSGYPVRYLMVRISESIREKKELLTQLEINYQQVTGELAAVPAQAGLFNQLADLFTRGIMKALMLRTEVERISAPMRAFALTESIADVEYAIKSHTWLKSLFSGWLRVHIAIAFILYLLLTLHVWSGIHFGLRWFS